MTWEYKPGFTLSNPDFDDTLYPSLEEKLGRKLTREENIHLFRRSGMFKEWLFNNLKECASTEEAEELFQKGKQPPAMEAKIQQRLEQERLEKESSRGWLGVLWEKLKRKL